MTYEYMQIGSTCIRDYIGYDSPEQIARQIEALDELVRELSDGEYSEYEGSREESRYDLGKVVTVAVAAVRLHGWVPASKAEEWDKRPTRAWVQDHLTAKRSEKKLFLDLIDQDAVDAEALLHWGRNQFSSPRSDYDHNMNVLLSKVDVRYRQLGFVCSLVGAWRKATMEKIAREAQPESNWVGEVGGKLEAEVKVLVIRSVETQYGLSYLVLFSEGGNILKWFASRKPDFFEEGDTVKITGTVKGHETYKDVKQTSLVRVKAFESPEQIKARKAQAKANREAAKVAEQALRAAEAAQKSALDAHWAKWSGELSTEQREQELSERAVLHTGPLAETVRETYNAWLEAARR